jgi:hypothetical protein
VGPVIEATNGEWAYGNWEYGFPGDPPPDTNEWDYEVDTPGGGGYWDSPYGDPIELGLYTWRRYTIDGHECKWFLTNADGYYTSDGYYSDKWFFIMETVILNPPWSVVDEFGNHGSLASAQCIFVREKLGWHEHLASYKRRTKTWVPGNNGSGSVNAVSSVNTSFISFTVNTTGISLGGDGSHSHTISIPTSGSSNENGHTHTISASGTADINVSGRTESGGIHSHTFDFKTNRDLYLLDLFGNLTTAKVPIAGETTVKNRKMRIWRRTA